MEKGDAPGAVLLVGHNGAVVYRKAYGNRALEPSREPMTPDTVFDVASLTKVVATTTSVMRMVQLGQVKLNDPVARYIPEFAQNGKGEVTVRQLLTHYSGLPADLELKPYWRGLDEAYARANAEKLVNPPGSTFLYSDVNFIVLGELVQRVSGMPLNQYAQNYVFGPLGMTHDDVQSTGDLEAAHRSHRARRSHWKHAAGRGTRSHGTGDGRSCRPCRCILHR